MMGNLPYLVAAYALVWIVLFAYLFNLSRKNKALQRELETIKEILASQRQGKTEG